MGVWAFGWAFGWSSGWADGEKVCLGCISETVRWRKLILGRDMGRGVGVKHHGVTLL